MASLHRALAGVMRGDLHKETGTDEGKEIPADKVEKAQNSSNPHVSAMGHLYPAATKINIRQNPTNPAVTPQAKPIKLGGEEKTTVEVAGADDPNKGPRFSPYSGN